MLDWKVASQFYFQMERVKQFIRRVKQFVRRIQVLVFEIVTFGKERIRDILKFKINPKCRTWVDGAGDYVHWRDVFLGREQNLSTQHVDPHQKIMQIWIIKVRDGWSLYIL